MISTTIWTAFMSPVLADLLRPVSTLPASETATTFRRREQAWGDVSGVAPRPTGRSLEPDREACSGSPWQRLKIPAASNPRR